MSGNRRVPLWVTAIIIVCVLPVIAFPAMLSETDAISENGMKLFLWLYPLYVAATAIIAWQCYGRRTLMTWVLLGLMLLTHAAMWLLVKMPVVA